MDNVPALIAYLDADLRYRVVNRRYAETLDADADTIIGKTPGDFLTPETYALARPMMDRALAGETVKFENQIVFKDGRRHWISVTYVPDLVGQGSNTIDPARRVQGFYALMVDIDERKRAEEALQISEQRFRDIVSASSDWFWEIDSDLRLSYLSERASDLGGIDIGRQIGMTPWEANDPDNSDQVWQEYRRLVEAHEAFRDFRGHYKGGRDGKLHHISISGIPLFDSALRFIGYRGSASDITKEIEAIRERERLQDFFAKALDMRDVSFAIYDPDEVMIYHNDTFASFVKSAGWNTSLGDHYEDVLREIIRLGSVEGAEGREDAWVEELLLGFRSLQVGEQEPQYRIKYRWLDGSEHWSDACRIRTAEGYTLARYTHVTDLVQREEQLRQAQKMEAVGQLTGGIAHDFNNILAVVLGNLDLMSEHVKDHEECANLAFKAIRAAERGALLTQRLLAFSRKQPLMPRPTDVNRLIRSIEDLLRRAIGEQNELEFVRAAGLWRCEVDPSQVENALLNMAINARDSMLDGGKLTLETANAYIDDEYAAAQLEVTPGQYVMIAVTDTGTGMSSSVKARIFEPFYTTKEAGQGSGLGLSMVYGFVKQSCGHISVYSEEDEGTTIKIYLPRAMAPDEKEPVTNVDRGDVTGRGQLVLVVEDDSLVRELARDLLVELGYRVFMAESGPKALSLLQVTEPIDLLLTDAVLPEGMNGRELARAVVAMRPGTAVLYMSGYTENAIIHHGRLDHDALLLQKPFRKKDLALKIREALAREMPKGDDVEKGES